MFNGYIDDCDRKDLMKASGRRDISFARKAQFKTTSTLLLLSQSKKTFNLTMAAQQSLHIASSLAFVAVITSIYFVQIHHIYVDFKNAELQTQNETLDISPSFADTSPIIDIDIDNHTLANHSVSEQQFASSNIEPESIQKQEYESTADAMKFKIFLNFIFCCLLLASSPIGYITVKYMLLNLMVITQAIGNSHPNILIFYLDDVRGG